jgi:ubiquinol-cytochrome c reductase iron-sulfur subunit
VSAGAPAPTADPSRPDERRVSRLMVPLLLVSIAAGVGLLILYALGGQVQLEGALLFIALSGVGFSLILWGKYLFPPEIVTEPRGEHESSEAEQLEAERTYLEGEREISRRSMLVRLLVGAFGALGLAAIFPIRSLGPSPGRTLFQTAWTNGTRLVDANGVPIRLDDLGLDGVVTVFPEGVTRRADSTAILVRVDPAQLALPEGRNQDAPDGNVCYSKLCTHAGCPVGLYLAQTHELQCPCHFSAFDVLNGAQPTFGPAARPLPQLPLEVDDEGYLVAKSDFTAPVGPGFWNRGDGP